MGLLLSTVKWEAGLSLVPLHISLRRAVLPFSLLFVALGGPIGGGPGGPGGGGGGGGGMLI